MTPRRPRSLAISPLVLGLLALAPAGSALAQAQPAPAAEPQEISPIHVSSMPTYAAPTPYVAPPMYAAPYGVPAMPPPGALVVYPPGYGPPNPPPRPVLRWRRHSVPYDGRPLPPGIAVHSRVRVGPLVAGFGALLVGEVAALYVWEFSNLCYFSCGPTPSAWMLVPVVGPWIAVGDRGTQAAGLVPWMVVFGVIEDLGLLAGIAGIAFKQHTIVVAEPVYGSRGHRAFDWAVLPIAAPETAGLAFAGSWF